MLMIRWSNSPSGDSEVAGDMKSILDLSERLEKSKTQFKVSNSSGALSQKQFDRAGNKYWLNPDESFTQ